jgi:hypothetical protein
MKTVKNMELSITRFEKQCDILKFKHTVAYRPVAKR